MIPPTRNPNTSESSNTAPNTSPVTPPKARLKSDVRKALKIEIKAKIITPFNPSNRREKTRANAALKRNAFLDEYTVKMYPSPSDDAGAPCLATIEEVHLESEGIRRRL